MKTINSSHERVREREHNRWKNRINHHWSCSVGKFSFECEAEQKIDEKYLSEAQCWAIWEESVPRRW